MAMHPKVKEGSILFYYPEIEIWNRYAGYNQPPVPNYIFSVKALYVYSRRARTNGTWVPKALEPFLNSLKIKISYRDTNSKRVMAVGCNTKTVFQRTVDREPNIPDEFIKAFKEIKERVDYSDSFFENEFILDKIESMKNSEKKFVLFPPKEQLAGVISVKDIQPLEDSDIWSDSGFNR